MALSVTPSAAAIALTEVVQQIVLKHPLALCVRQTIQRMADMFKAFHALDQFLRRKG